jgi:hypothetical protein
MNHLQQLKRRALVAATLEQDLENTIDAVEECIKQSLSNHQVPSEFKELLGIILGDAEVSSYAQVGYDALWAIKVLREAKLDFSARQAVCAGIGLGMAVYDIEVGSSNSGRPEDELAKALRHFYNDYILWHPTQPGLDEARQYIKNECPDIYDSKRRSGYWDSPSFRQQWHKLRKRFKKERELLLLLFPSL